eukprot:8499194-Alexandrium_andersonii.AAC.1
MLAPRLKSHRSAPRPKSPRSSGAPDGSRTGVAPRAPTDVAQARHPDRGRADAGPSTEVAQERSPTEV